MEERHVVQISKELSLKVVQVAATIAMLDEGGTVPFISRYRKEATGSLDEVAITTIRDRIEQLRDLDKRRASILETIEGQGKLTPELQARIMAAETMTILEDLYLPYRPKRRTRATVAREKGLEPLAVLLMEQGQTDPEAEAAYYIDKEKGVETIEDALAGARDILAEHINEDSTARDKIRTLYRTEGVFVCKVMTGKEEEGVKYKDYFDWSEPVAKAPSHRILAMRRGAKEKILSLHVQVDEEKAIAILESAFIKDSCPATPHVKAAVRDAFKRLLSTSMETEIRLETKIRADEEAIRVFTANLRQLLLSPPLGRKRVMALDPGFRTGCKLICLDAQGKLVHDDVVYLHQSPQKDQVESERIKGLCEQYQIEAIAVGNGTAGRETEAVLRTISFGRKIPIVMVNESGASVYSASDVAREEFPKYDVTVRGAVSIGRRLMDPLAELVKIDPKSIGVGQYQHDVDQNNLKHSLDDTVVSCVNSVGVEVNTASKQLLTYVSGLGPTVASNIVAWRDQHGPFRMRHDLMQIRGMGDKTFEQCAGFLRIRDGINPLDASAVHPESYSIVEAMCNDLQCSIVDLMQNPELRDKIELNRYQSEMVGMPTLLDIKTELAKPGRDPRQTLEPIEFTEGVNSIADLKAGMKLTGIVTNVTAFGAFVDIGVHQDGLVHISELSERFVKDPSDVVKIQQKVQVWVLDVDVDRKRISLSMKMPPEKKPQPEDKRQKPKAREGRPQKPPSRKPAEQRPRSKKDEPFGESLGIQLKRRG
ncbi:MAG: RNA-binding transcriptional accessory protein [Sedimentisphaerales bacterium]|nr:RNA-binding transcriptional accessory protein [Sedimentisphaerales bacterium]